MIVVVNKSSVCKNRFSNLSGKVTVFRDKAIQGRSLALLKEKTNQPQIEHKKKGISMPENFKELIKELKK